MDQAPEYGIAHSQTGVFYDAGDESLLLFGGWIANTPTRAQNAQTGTAVYNYALYIRVLLAVAISYLKIQDYLCEG